LDIHIQKVGIAQNGKQKSSDLSKNDASL
jgi:hypothetical protein